MPKSGWVFHPAANKIKCITSDIWRIAEENGERKLAENWVMIDILGVLEQAGYDVKKVLKFVGSKPPEFFEGE
jgi:DNA-binding ferritin-like protein (Dps family)